MKLEDTVIEQGGVMRCCLGTIGLEYLDKAINIGAKSVCPHCKTVFVLRRPEDVTTTCYRNLKQPIWQPLWQVKKGKKP